MPQAGSARSRDVATGAGCDLSRRAGALAGAAPVGAGGGGTAGDERAQLPPLPAMRTACSIAARQGVRAARAGGPGGMGARAVPSSRCDQGDRLRDLQGAPRPPCARGPGPQGAQAWRRTVAGASASPASAMISGSRHEWLAGQADLIARTRHLRDRPQEEGTASTFRALKRAPSAQQPLHRRPLLPHPRGRRQSATSNPTQVDQLSRTHRRLVAPGARPLRARLRPPGPPGQGASPASPDRERDHNRRSQQSPSEASAFVSPPPPDQVDEVLCMHTKRDNTVRHERRVLQIPASPARPHCQGHGPGARVSRRHTRPLPRTQMPRPLSSTHQSGSGAASTQPADACLLHQAPRLTTSPQGQQQQKRTIDACYRAKYTC